MTSGSVARNTGWSWSSLLKEARDSGLTGAAAEERALGLLQYQTGLVAFGQVYDLAGQLKTTASKGGGLGTMTAHGAKKYDKDNDLRDPRGYGEPIRLDIHDEIPRTVLHALPPESSVLDLIDRWDDAIAQGFYNPLQRLSWIYRQKLTQSTL